MKYFDIFADGIKLNNGKRPVGTYLGFIFTVGFIALSVYLSAEILEDVFKRNKFKFREAKTMMTNEQFNKSVRFGDYHNGLSIMFQ